LQQLKEALRVQIDTGAPNINKKELLSKIKSQLDIYSTWKVHKFTLKNLKMVLVASNMNLFQRAIEARTCLPGNILTQEPEIFVTPIKSMHWLKTVLFKGCTLMF
jgi:hypothetical protein